MRRSWFIHVASAIAVWLSLVPMGALVTGGDVLTRSVPLLVACAGVGAVLSRLAVPRLVVFLLQGVAVAGVLLWQGFSLAGGWGASALLDLARSGLQEIRAGAAPMDPVPSVAWLCLVLTAALLLMVTLLGDSLEQPAWSIAPLGLVYGIAAIISLGDLDWLYAVPVVAAYVLLLATGTPLGNDAAGSPRQRRTFQLSRAVTCAIAGAAALALAMTLSVVVPLGTQRPWQEGSENGPIQLGDPTIRLDQDLRRPEDTHVLTYETDTGQPVYLRTVALSEITSEGAKLVPMNLSRFGLGNAYRYPGTRTTVKVELAAPSEFLPAPFAPDSFTADGIWAFDPQTLSIVASGPERAQQSVGLSYTVTSDIPTPSRDELRAATAGTPPDRITEQVPDGLDDGVGALVEAVTRDAATDGEKALAIQAFLRSDRFTYSLSAPAPNGSDSISTFLTSERSGYCVHFATAMALMARLAGIPSRIAVGFAPGDKVAEGTFEVSTHDAHAWPELFFDSLGWVAFEPTPGFSGGGSGDAEDEPSAAPSPTSSAARSSSAPAPTEDVPEDAPSTPAGVSDPGSGGGAATGVGVTLLGLLVALLATPMTMRAWQRHARLRAGSTPTQAFEGAWAELRATFVDHGLAWPAGSPVPAAEAAADLLGQSAAEALAAVAVQVERSRFARPGEAPAPDLAAQVARVRRAVAARSGRWARVRAVVAPASVFTLHRR